MKQMACLGYNASLAALCKIRDEPAETVEALFRNLALNGIVMSVEDGYSFCHDRIYEAAYELTPVAEKPAVHLGIGRALLGSRNIAELNDEIFDIAEQFGRGASAIESPGDKEWAANLNLSAARRAMSTVAYASALSILKAAEAHLGDRTQERNNRLVFDVELCRAECELLAGHVDNARPRLEDLRARASHLSDRLIVARLRLALHVTLGQANLAVQVGLEFLGELEESLNAHPTDSDVIQQYDCLQRLLSGQPPEAMLLSLPLMNDSRCRAVMQMLADLMPPAEFTDPHLLELVILRMANLSLEFGNCDASCYAYSALHLVLGSRFDENELGYEFARLGFELVDNPALSTHRARVHLCVGGLVIPWTRALASGLPMIRRAFEEANAAGDP